MLEKEIRAYIEKQVASARNGEIELYKEEKDFALVHQLLNSDVLESFTLTEKDPISRFNDAYIERSDKETEEVIATVDSKFFSEPIDFLKNHKREFIYVETQWFNKIGVDAVSLEVDDVFGTYDVMLGIALQKKHGPKIKEFLNDHLHSNEPKFELIFNGQEGMWDLNFTLNHLQDFKEDITIGEAYIKIYRLLFTLMASVDGI